MAKRQLSYPKVGDAKKFPDIIRGFLFFDP